MDDRMDDVLRRLSHLEKMVASSRIKQDTVEEQNADTTPREAAHLSLITSPVPLSYPLYPIADSLLRSAYDQLCGEAKKRGSVMLSWQQFKNAYYVGQKITVPLIGTLTFVSANSYTFKPVEASTQVSFGSPVRVSQMAKSAAWVKLRKVAERRGVTPTPEMECEYDNLPIFVGDQYSIHKGKPGEPHTDENLVVRAYFPRQDYATVSEKLITGPGRLDWELREVDDTGRTSPMSTAQAPLLVDIRNIVREELKAYHVTGAADTETINRQAQMLIDRSARLDAADKTIVAHLSTINRLENELKLDRDSWRLTQKNLQRVIDELKAENKQLKDDLKRARDKVTEVAQCYHLYQAGVRGDVRNNFPTDTTGLLDSAYSNGAQDVVKVTEALRAELTRYLEELASGARQLNQLKKCNDMAFAIRDIVQNNMDGPGVSRGGGVGGVGVTYAETNSNGKETP